MKKKGIVLIGAVSVLALSLTIPQVSAFAMSALTVFRVGSTKTINITLDDIAQISVHARNKISERDTWQHDFSNMDFDRTDFESKDLQSVYTKLNDVSEFTAFDVNLPKEMKDSIPELYATDLKEQTLEIEDGKSISIAVSPIFMARYENLVYVATQGINDTVPLEMKAELKENILQLPILTDNLRSQLAAIDPDTKDIYLPVVAGVSREADLGGTVGYIYSTNDLNAIIGTLPEELSFDMAEKLESMESANTSALIWTKNGVLNILAGSMPDGELIKIARSVR